ncbi:hypothetical protein UVI_02016460 [Ustilaginoidea virens]|uniref:Uncharacterized protein n=1 Tax=Ustilaginoidea virens TaxID=1159556 RepID=A0A1B5KRQ8_USTVR|nr:hypothetical protein UVI_02016460 [Ustilaginoidea virens]
MSSYAQDMREFLSVERVRMAIASHLESDCPMGYLLEEFHGRKESLDCLTQLIRHLRAQFLDYEGNAYDAAEEACNPILRYSWLNFVARENSDGYDGRNGQKDAAVAGKRQVYAAL